MLREHAPAEEAGTPGGTGGIVIVHCTHGLNRTGYVMVRVWGSSLSGGTDYRCRLNGRDTVSASYSHSLDCILCWSDLWRSGFNGVEVTLNGRDYTSNNATVFIKEL